MGAQTIELRPYQQDAIGKLKRGWFQTHGTKYHRSQLVVLATGLGKTILFASVIDEVLAQGGRALVLAHREELLDQAEEKIKWVVGENRTYGREQASLRASLTDHIVIASVMSLGRQKDDQFCDRLTRFPKDHFKLIVIDEAHHAVSSSYQTVLSYFATPETWVLGVTATPKRSDKESLTHIFDRVAYRLDIVDGSRGSFLTPVVSHRISSDTDLSGIRTTAGDFNLKDLADRVNNVQRNSLIIKTYVSRFLGKQAIVFATSVEHAQALDTEFKQAGVSCHAISGDMDKEERRAAIRDFKDRKIDILTNYGVLTEGFDHSSLDLIINARPTKSDLLLTQILGRGTRLHTGKTHLDFVEIIDNHSEQTATAAEVFGFPQVFDCEGHHFMECIQAAERMEKEKEGFNPWTYTSWTQMHDAFKMGDKADHLLKPGEPEPITRRYLWYPYKGSSFRISRKVNKLNNEPGRDHYLLQISPYELGGYVYTLELNGEQMHRATHPEVIPLIDYAEYHMQTNSRRMDAILDQNAAWRIRANNEPCTDKQWDTLKRFRLARKPRNLISKGEAMKILDEFFNRDKG